MKKITPIILSLSLVVGSCGCSKHVSDAKNDKVAALDSLFEHRYGTDADAPSPGAAVIVAMGDSIVYERYFGIADMLTGERISRETLFNIASISKQFTVAALLRQGVDMNRPVTDFAHYDRPFWKEITLAHLASHSSGLPDDRDRSDRTACVYADEVASLAFFPEVKELKFSPGTDYDYQNPTFILLANAAEKVAGEDFYTYVPRELFGTAGMKSAVYFNRDSMPEHTAHGYIHGDDGTWRKYDYGEETFFATRPDGGIYATARDMLAWESALASGKIMADSALQMAYAPRVNVADSKWCDYQRRPHTSYGLGWFVDSTPGRHVKVYHTGDNGGFQAYVAKYPTTGLRIIVLENRNDRDRWAMAQAVDSIMLQ